MVAIKQNIKKITMQFSLKEIKFLEWAMDTYAGGIPDKKLRYLCAKLEEKFKAAQIEHKLRSRGQ
ncbi:MAG: hypothetical protein NTY53_14425 [Kiritimatiellaeota bacterium]|nr:hypothetical protein [Kiritimatiellota bacterium]